MKLIYQIFILGYTFAIRMASIFNLKAKQWLVGREKIFDKLHSEINQTDTIVWFHCASLGEFEQAKPVIEGYRLKYAEHKILITFFSPSGYELRKDYKGADYVFYLPIDTAFNSKRFIEIVQPIKAFFVKYEFWYFYLHTLAAHQIPTYLISGVFRKNQLFFKWYGTWYRKILACFTHFFVQNESSKELLIEHGYNHVTVSGDTRFDRVFDNMLHPTELPVIKAFKNNQPILIGGSSWPTEEKIMAQYISNSQTDVKLIIAPHDVSEKHVEQIETLFKDHDCIRYSVADEQNVTLKKVLIINHIGILAHTYQYTDVAFIGGGFTGALHNILEPCSYGNMVLFGPHHFKFHEAQDLINDGGAVVIANATELSKVMAPTNLNLSKIKDQNRSFIEHHKGATQLILDQL